MPVFSWGVDHELEGVTRSIFERSRRGTRSFDQHYSYGHVEGLERSGVPCLEDTSVLYLY